MSGAPMDVHMADATNSVLDGSTDFAINCDQDRIRVRQDARQMFKRVWLWKPTTNNNRSYEAERDGAIPSNEQMKYESEEPKEQQSGSYGLYEIVGLVIADQPERTLTKGKSGGYKTAEKQTLDARELKVLRVVSPVCQNIPQQVKYSVACDPTGGRCYAKSINIDSVFFFEEYWRQVQEENMKAKKLRKPAISIAVGKAVAIEKTAKPAAAPVVATQLQKAQTSNSLVVTEGENMVNHLVMNFSMFSDSRDTTYAQGIFALLGSEARGMRFGPSRSDSVFEAFLDAEEEFDIEQAKEMKALLEVKTSAIQVADILELRNVLIQNSLLENIERDDIGSLIDGFVILRSSSTPLDAAQNSMQMLEAMKQRQKSLVMDEEHDLSLKDVRYVIGLIRSALINDRDHHDGFGERLIHQHGAMLPRKTMTELLDALAEATDVAAVRSLHDQVAAIHAAQYMTAIEEQRKRYNMIIDFCGTLLQSIPEQEHDEQEADDEDIEGGEDQGPD